MENLLRHRKKIYSQYGEEGVLEYIIKQLKLGFLNCCEFGMNGKRNSNTFYFIENYKSFGVYIEPRANKLKELKRKNVKLINKSVELIGANTLDDILTTTSLPNDFDILSIDIDNNDYHVWSSLKKYSPKIIIIEINPFIRPNKEYIHDGYMFSSSFLSTVKLGISKGYKLVCMTGNLIFVKRSILEGSNLKSLLNVKEETLFLYDAFIDPNNIRKFNFKRYVKPTKII